MKNRDAGIFCSLVYLLGLGATQYLVGNGSVSEVDALWAWLVIVVGSVYLTGRTVKKIPESVKTTWMSFVLLFVVVEGALLLGYWNPGVMLPTSSIFFSILLILFGAAMFGSSHDMKMSHYSGLMYLAIGIIFPFWFSLSPFLMAGLVLGLTMLVENWRMK